MATGRISKRSVDALSCPPGKDRDFLWDDNLKGFGCCVHESGRKIYVVKYTLNGLSKRITIGPHGPITPDQARDKATVLLGQVIQGSDPATERRTAREVPTFEYLAEEFMRLHASAACGTRTQAEYRGWLRRLLLPAFGKKRLDAITKKDLAEFKKDNADKAVTANR